MAKSSLLRWLSEPDPPHLGIEFRRNQIVLVRFGGKKSRPEMNLCLKAPLPAGVLDFSLLTPNLLDPEGTGRFFKQRLDEAGVGGGPLALTLPDSLARFSITELPTSARSRRDVEELIRFRLRKTLPFDVDQARVSFERVDGGKFLVGIMHEAVVTQYEEFLERQGFQVGVVETSTVSLLNLLVPLAEKELTAEADYFFVNLEEPYFTVSLIGKRETPLLVRTLGQRSAEEPREQLALAEGRPTYGEGELVRELVATVIYYREKLQRNGLARVYYRSLREDLGDVGSLLESHFEVPAEPLDLTRAVGIGASLKVDHALAATASAAAGAALARAA
jgi:hypothetical protein